MEPVKCGSARKDREFSTQELAEAKARVKQRPCQFGTASYRSRNSFLGFWLDVLLESDWGWDAAAANEARAETERAPEGCVPDDRDRAALPREVRTRPRSPHRGAPARH